MEFFGIGVLEILAVFLLMAIVFGPHRLPEIARQFGRAVRELREYARDFRDEYLTDFEEVREEYLETRYELQRTDSALRQELRDIDHDLKSAVQEAERDAETALVEAEAAAKGAEAPAAKPAAPARAAGAAAETPRTATAERPGRGGRRRRLGSGKAQPARPGNVISINRRRAK